MSLSTIRKELGEMRFCTAHAMRTRADVVNALLKFERRDRRAKPDVRALKYAYKDVCWLIAHVHEIDDKYVCPSQRIFLTDASQALWALYVEMGGQ